jgi:hypothetical protein
MKMIKLFFAIILFYVSTDTHSQPCNSLNSLQWILGDWRADSGKTINIESWRKVSAKTFEGFGESRTKDSNTPKSTELLRLIEMANELFYIAKPKQNNLPVAFKLIHCTIKSAVFENPEHDFPNKLEYKLTADNKMVVTVSGIKGKSFTLNFIRQDGS